MTSLITFTIPAVELLAVALAAAKQDIRYYLNGVAFEFAADGLYLIATDGHRMHVIKAQPTYATATASEVESLTGRTIIVPIEAVKSIKARKVSDLLDVTIDQSQVTLSSYGDPSISCEELSRGFPEWRRVLPKPSDKSISPVNPGATVNPQYLSDAFKAIALLCGHKDPAYQYQFVEPDLNPKTGEAHPFAHGVFVLGENDRFVAYIEPSTFTSGEDHYLTLDLPTWLSPKPSADNSDLV